MRLAVVIMALSMTACLADRLLLWPQKARATPRAESRLLTRPDGALEVIVARGDTSVEPEAFVLRFYGNAQLANDIGYEAAAHGDPRLEWWGVNYPGYGNSAGPTTLRRLATAARDAYAAIAKVARGRPIILVGNSMGTVAALHVAAHERVAGLILHNPPPLRELILLRHGWYNLWLVAAPVALQLPKALDSLANAAQVRAPALFLSSSRDAVVPPRFQHKVMRSYAGAWRVLELRGAGHNDALPDWARAAVADQIRAWSR
ncbi:MAG: alpha/beta fold hydrolase [Deltaproteobacteria bacterium]|nr:alpha/beta fold hydrolase [Deltaproteobacteria bacterium]